ncbi:sulfatase-like hydrolase/transferase [Draconibacterium sp.]|nr:sulfatase-like hydrolase/transferase [Draconibacterium sp.]
MKLKTILTTFFLFTVALTRADEKPNIIFIFTDDLGYGDLGVFFQNQRAKEKGFPAAFTPNLDKLAEQGVQLTQQYCAAPVCAPSRGSLLTGRSQGHANVRDNQFDKALEDNHTLATVLKEAGYSTAAIGKWGLQGKTDNIPDWPAHPNKRGFDYYYGYIRHGDGHEHYPKEGIYRGSKEVYENYTNVANGLDKCYTADLWTAAAKRWIVQQKQGKEKKKPFFIYLAFDTPHAVLELPTQAYPKGGGLKGGIQWIGEPGHMINTASGEVDSWIHPDYAHANYDDDANPSTPEISWPDVYKRYATDTRRIDDAVGDIVQLLKDLKIDKNTMIVFASDNGPSKESYLKGQPYNPNFFKSYARFDGIKRDCLEGGVRVPVIACWSGKIPAGRIVETPSISYDWLPTFAEMAGIPAPATSDGISLLPSLTGLEKQKEGLVYVEYFQKGITPKYSDFTAEHQGRKRNQMQMIRFGDLVGLRYDIQSHNDNFEIYNVMEDPQESVDLATLPEMAAVQQKMKDKVLQSRRPDDSAPRPYDYELIPAVEVKNPTSGVRWSIYGGEFPWIPEIGSMTPSESGYSEKPALSVRTKNENEVLYFSGYINIPKDGEYNFSLTTGSGALFRIHNCLVIDEDFGYQGGIKRSGIINLKAGMHPFRLYCTQKTKDKPMLDFEWSGPGWDDRLIPSSVFFHR